MIKEKFSIETRDCLVKNLVADLVVVGGGMAGVCCAITAARDGIGVILVQDRPVLGGNASSEVRLWILGATSHMGNNNRWAREGGVIDELLIENLKRNPEGNTLIFDTILLEKVTNETNISLLLNTGVFDLDKADSDSIKKVKAFCSQNSTYYDLEAPLYCDASGDGIVAFKAGAAFRMGAESKTEFGELFAPEKPYGELLGHTLYFYSKETDQPIEYTAPAFALKDIKALPKYKILSSTDFGCRLWWIEYGGIHDTIHDTEKIKWELWRIVYGVWDHIKNSGEFEGVDNLTLEWVGTIPGKRESRRFEGQYMLKQQDIVEQKEFFDAVAFGGWAIDLHPAEGVYSKLPSCNQYHSKGVYQIPYRCYVSKDIENLFYAGRIISATHVAFGSSRVMATCAHGGQAVGMAASMCAKQKFKPKELLDNNRIEDLQQKLNVSGQSIPEIPIQGNNILNKSKLSASSEYILEGFPANGPWISLYQSTAQMLPLKAGTNYEFEFLLKTEIETEVICELRTSEKLNNHTPEVILEQLHIHLHEGKQHVKFGFSKALDKDKYGFITFLKNADVSIKGTNFRQTGILSVFNKKNKSVSNNGAQRPPEGIGIDTFEFWTPARRPEGHNLAFKINPPINDFKVENLLNGKTRPSNRSNAWISDLSDPNPRLEFHWEEIQKIHGLQLHFDTDFDHPLESSLLGHPEKVIPLVIQSYKVKNCNEEVIYEQNYNYQTINKITFPEPIETAALKIEIEHPSAEIPAALFHVQFI